MKDKNKYLYTFFWLTVFSISMGFLEGIVVVYLRNIFYTNGFDFPIHPDFSRLAGVEILREAVTIIMLMSVGIIAGKNFFQKFLIFLFCFGVWDIVYYIALKILLSWPPSLLSFDILFLIPITWIAPVLAPVLCSVVFIIFGYAIITYQEKGYKVEFKTINWILFFAGSLIVFITFIWDFASIIIRDGFIGNILSLDSDENFKKIVSTFIPTFYNWYAFAAGEVLVIISFILPLKKKHLNAGETD